MQDKETFGTFVRHLREQRNLPIRKVAACLDLDASTLSKIERGERNANKEHIKILAILFEISEESLLINYLSDKVASELVYESCSDKVLKAAGEKIKYLRAQKTVQKELKF